METEIVVPTGRHTLKNLATGETYHYNKVEEVHPKKVEFIDVDTGNGHLVRAMCLSLEDGYAVFFQGVSHN